MPLKDVDGGLVWQGYNPRLFNDRLPKEARPFYFGGSQVPIELGKTTSGSGFALSYRPKTKKVMKLPSMRTNKF